MRRTTALIFTLAKVARRWTRARGVAVLRRTAGRRLRVLASDRLTQASLNYLHKLWAGDFHVIASGCVHADTAGPADSLHVVIPCVSGDSVLGVLYLETPAAALPPMDALYALGTVAGVLLGDRRSAPRRPTTARPGTPLAPLVEAANLRALLQRHEWNIARVARLLGVTRMTIYNRLRRHQVRREHVRRQTNCTHPRRQGRATNAPRPAVGAA
jgi:hypothetical protein